MRILNRAKKIVWISNEIGFEQYSEPFAINAMVSPYKSNTTQDFAIDLDYDVLIETTLKEVKGKGITASSWFWIGRGNSKPILGTDGATHTMMKPIVTADEQNVIIILKKQEEYNPLD